MLVQSFDEIINVAHSIDIRINLFDGYVPKDQNGYNGELLFWREIVSVYGLLADSDRVQIKEKNNLFELFYNYSLISENDYETVKRFWNYVNHLRKWLCHNQNPNLYYSMLTERSIEKFLDSAYVISSNKPQRLEDVQTRDWGLLCFFIENEFQKYLSILQNGLEAWKKCEQSKDIINEWIAIFSSALFNDKELISNVLFDIAKYKKITESTPGISTSSLANQYKTNLLNGGFSAEDIKKELVSESEVHQTNKDIVYKSICNFNGFCV